MSKTLAHSFDQSTADYLNNCIVSGSLVTGSILPCNIYTGESNLDKDAPCIIIMCGDGQEMMKDTGVYTYKPSVVVKEIAADIRYENLSVLAQNVFEVIQNTSFINNTYMSASGIFVYDMHTYTTSIIQSGDCTVNTLEFTSVMQ